MKFYLIFLRYFVVGLLFFPTIVQNIHNLIHHEHVHCNTSSLHFHEIENECELIDNFIISDFSIVNKNYISFNYSFQNLSNWKQSKYTSYSLLQRLRAPPILIIFIKPKSF
tara:strand:- start:23135 stop:23467 length:333 start_codon:yes stop_codon:yes gene_type:complete